MIKDQSNIQKLIAKGKLIEAESTLKKYILDDPLCALSYSNLAVIYFQKGEFEESKNLLEKSIELDPNFLAALNSLGIVYQRLSCLEKSILSFKKALEIHPDFLEALNNLGFSYILIKDYNNARLCFEELLCKSPNDITALYRLGMTLEATKLFDKAIDCFQKVVDLSPKNVNALNSLGHLLNLKGDKSAALKKFEKGLEIKPDFFQLLLNLGIVSQEMRLYEKSEKYFLKALRIRPNDSTTYFLYGNFLKEIKNYDKALEAYKKCLNISPEMSKCINNIGTIYQDKKDFLQAVKYYKLALSIDKEHSFSKAGLIYCQMHLNDWSNYKDFLNWLPSLGLKDIPVEPLIFMALDNSPQRHLSRASFFYERKYKVKEDSLSIKISNKKIKIGYFSSNFYDHPVMILMINIFERYDQECFEIYAYSLTKVIKNKYINRMIESGITIRDVSSLNNDQILEISRSDNLNIAVDLMGFTKQHRMHLFSRRIAPSQISYLGYPGSCGSDCIDYLIGDKTLIPSKLSKFYSEKILYLPHTYQILDTSLIPSNKVFTRSMFNLPEDSFVFACFNSNHKITPIEFDIWVKLLLEVDNSVLWLINSDRNAISNLYREASSQGLSEERIIFSPTINLEDHMARHHCADLFLDTFNYNAGITASLSLRSNLPLLTLAGESYTSRMGASLLAAINMRELITYDQNEYFKKAKLLAEDKNYLIEIQDKMKNNIVKFNDYLDKYFVKDLEKIYKKVVKRSI